MALEMSLYIGGVVYRCITVKRTHGVPPEVSAWANAGCMKCQQLLVSRGFSILYPYAGR